MPSLQVLHCMLIWPQCLHCSATLGETLQHCECIVLHKQLFLPATKFASCKGNTDSCSCRHTELVMQVMEENKRQLCIRQQAEARHQSWLWWSYVKLFNQNCRCPHTALLLVHAPDADTAGDLATGSISKLVQHRAISSSHYHSCGALVVLLSATVSPALQTDPESLHKLMLLICVKM